MNTLKTTIFVPYKLEFRHLIFDARTLLTRGIRF